MIRRCAVLMALLAGGCHATSALDVDYIALYEVHELGTPDVIAIFKSDNKGTNVVGCLATLNALGAKTDKGMPRYCARLN